MTEEYKNNANKTLLMLLTAYILTLLIMFTTGFFVIELFLHRSVVKVSQPSTPPVAQGPYCRPGAH